MPVEIVAIGQQRPPVMEALEREFVVHKIWDATDKAAAAAPFADRVRGAVSHGMAGLPTALIKALPRLEICAINGVGLETTDPIVLHLNGVTGKIAKKPAVPLFDDTLAWWSAGDGHASPHPGRYQPGWYGVDVPDTGTTIRVVSSKHGVMTVKVAPK